MTAQQIHADWQARAELTPAERTELTNLSAADITARFDGLLPFGTAGQRGHMQLGTARINRFTVALTTQALCRVLLQDGRSGGQVAIAYDSRHQSAAFAAICADVLTGNGFVPFLFDDIRPTPELSFAVRRLGCVAGINITASHNPKEYNGYKVFGDDGAQLGPDYADRVMAVMLAMDMFADVQQAPHTPTPAADCKALDEAYLNEVLAQAVDAEAVAKCPDFALVFTPFHGAGRLLVPEALRRLGLRTLHTVDSQMIADGDFPTVVSPNPEDAAGFAQAMVLAEQTNCDCIIGTDPDADRIGLVAKTAGGEWYTFTGNQIGVLLLDFVIRARQRMGTMPPNPAAVVSIVSTPMAGVICAAHNVHMDRVLTGFKYIGEKIEQYNAQKNHKFIFGFEESHGYVAGEYCRDKDAVLAATLLAQMACHYRLQGMTLHDALQHLYETHGYFTEHTISVTITGPTAQARMAQSCAALRADPPSHIGQSKVVATTDFAQGTIQRDGQTTKADVPAADVVAFDLEDGSRVMVRPSGTEPKIKIYLMARGQNAADCAAAVAALTLAAPALVQ